MNSTAPGYTYDQTLAPSPVSMAELDELKASVAWTEHDREALRRAGQILVPRAEEILDVWYGFVGSHPHLVGTFAAAGAQRAEWMLWRDPELGIDFQRVVHGEERIEKQRPLVAGDVIRVSLTVDRVREVRGNAMITTRADLTDANDEEIATVWSMIVVRGDES